MSIPSFSEWPDIPQRSAPEADFDAKMYALFQHFATTHRNEMLAFINFLENNSTVINGALNGTTIGLNTPAAGKFTSLLADSLGGAAVQSSATDSTDGRLWKSNGSNGAFGLGAVQAPNVDDADLLTVSGLYRTINATVNTPVSSWGHTILHQQFDQNNATQLFSSGSSNKLFIRRKRTGAWHDWQEIITDKGGQTINGDFSVDGDTLHVKSGNKRVGLGTLDPKDRLHVAGSGVFEGLFPNIRLLETDASGKNTRMVNNSDKFIIQTIQDLDTWVSDRFVVDHDTGNIGIKEGAPSGRLHIRQNAGVGGWLLRAQTVGINNPSGIWQDASNNMELAIRDGSDTGTVQARIASTGYSYLLKTPLGLGKSNPAAKLDVLNEDGGTTVNVTSGTGNVSNNHALGVTHQDPNFSNDVVRIIATRAATSAYSFITGRSGGGSDIEFLIDGTGHGKSDGGWSGTGADYAEYFEWALAWIDWAKDWKTTKGTLAGISVVLEGDKIRPAQDGEQPIGVISAAPSVVGDADVDRWKGKYLKNDFGEYVWEDYEVVSWTETVTETETVEEQAIEEHEITGEVIEVVDGQPVRKIVTETIKVPLFDELLVVDEQGTPVMRPVQVGMTDPVLDENGDEVEPAQAVYEDRQMVHRAPRMIEVQKETTKEIEHSYSLDEVPKGVAVPADATRVIQKRRKLNPEYDPSQPYVPRAERPEWDMVGLMGKLRLRKGQPVAPNWIKMRDVSAEVEEWLVK